MGNELIDEKGLDAAVQWSLSAERKGDRFLKEFGVRQLIEAYLNGIEPGTALPGKDKDLGNMIQQVRSYLQDNQPVMAYQWINTIKEYLERRGNI